MEVQDTLKNLEKTLVTTKVSKKPWEDKDVEIISTFPCSKVVSWIKEIPTLIMNNCQFLEEDNLLLGKNIIQLFSLFPKFSQS